MQVDPIKPTVKAPESRRLKQNFDELLSNGALKFTLRPYTKVVFAPFNEDTVGVYDTATVRRCRSILSNPC